MSLFGGVGWVSQKVAKVVGGEGVSQKVTNSDKKVTNTLKEKGERV